MTPNLPDFNSPLVQTLLDPSNLTTPGELDENVLSFCSSINSDDAPVFLDCQPEQWSRVGCCNLNVKKYIELNGGAMLCGYQIWYIDQIYIEAERHAAWSSDSGALRNVSFSTDGESKVLFIKDQDPEAPFAGPPIKLRKIIAESLAPMEEFMSMADGLHQPQAENDAWNSCETYEAFVARTGGDAVG